MLVVCFKRLGGDFGVIEKHISLSLSPIEGLKIATGKRPLSFWIISSANALLKV